MNKLAICQEIFEKHEIETIIQKVAAFGYDGLELAPFKFADDIRNIPPERLVKIKNLAEKNSLELIACHWLLVSPEGMHITSPEQQTFKITKGFFRALIDFAHTLGVQYLVFGSPDQRTIKKTWDQEDAYDRAVNFFLEMGDLAAENDLVIAFEPLGPQITNLGGTFSDALQLLDRIDHPAVKLHLDVSAMVRDPMDIEEQIRKVNLEKLAYVHVNDPNKKGPGMGDLDFKPIIQQFIEKGYDGWFSVETFDFDIPADVIASESLVYMREILNEL